MLVSHLVNLISLDRCDASLSTCRHADTIETEDDVLSLPCIAPLRHCCLNVARSPTPPQLLTLKWNDPVLPRTVIGCVRFSSAIFTTYTAQGFFLEFATTIGQPA
jgi:hypothetical protein